MSEYFSPQYGSTGFHCPYCNVYADQKWTNTIWKTPLLDINSLRQVREGKIDIKGVAVEVSTCSHCENPTFWLDEKIIYPPTRMSPPANSDLPDSVKEFYEEAASIANLSYLWLHAGACALLRLANRRNAPQTISDISKKMTISIAA